MSRYLERAKQLCRLLRLQAEALVDRPLREIRFGWHRIYRCVNSAPPPGSLEAFASEAYTLADSYTLADHLTFERLNPDSVWSCFALGRENARQMRRCISAEMWTRLNLAYLRLGELEIREIWGTSPESFYAETAAEIDTFAGVVRPPCTTTRAGASCSLGAASSARSTRPRCCWPILPRPGWATSRTKRTGSACCAAVMPWRRTTAAAASRSSPTGCLDLLVTNPLLPGSLCHALDAAAAELTAIGPGPHAHTSAAVQRLASRLTALIHHEWPERQDREELLRQVGEHCGNLHQLVADTYFEYPVEGLPGR